MITYPLNILRSLMEKSPQITYDQIKDFIENSSNFFLLERFNHINYKIDSGPSILKTILNPFLLNTDKIYSDTISLQSLNEINESTNVCICISGFMSEEINQIEAWDGFIKELYKHCDFYYFNWPAGSEMQLGVDVFKKEIFNPSL